MMLHRSHSPFRQRICQASLLAAILAIGFGGLSADAAAQQPAPAAKKAPTPAGANPQWVKVCEKTPVGTMFRDGKEETRFKNYCLTQHELIDGTTGRALMSAAVRQMDGEPTQFLMVLVPLNVNLKAGIRAALYPKELESIQQFFDLCQSNGAAHAVIEIIGPWMSSGSFTTENS
jgi:invasion protein IalB